jgi:hypothetical protein
MKMIALKTFSLGGANLTFQDEEFDVAESRVEEYVRLGLAKPVGEGAAVTPPTNSPPRDIARTDYNEEELKAMTMKELKEIAKNIGVQGYSTLTKMELIFAIRGQQNINRGGLNNA